MCWLSFLTSPFLSAHCQIGQGMQVNSSRWHHVLPRIFSSLPTPRLSTPPPLRQMPIGFYRQVALDFPACFDFYGKFLGLTFITSFLPKFLNILLDPPPGAGTLYSIPAGWIEIFLQSSKRTNSDKADIALNDLLLVLTNQKSNSSN